MPIVRDLESELQEIPNWTHVSFKKNILSTLERCLDGGERVENVLEGFYQGITISGTGSGAPGLLCISDRRILFLISGRSSNPPEMLDYEDVVSVETRRGYSSTRIALKLVEGDATLTAVTKTNHIDAFLADLTRKIEAPVAEVGHERGGAERRLANLGFLHAEAKKIYVSVSEYKQFNGEPSFLSQMVADLFLLSHLSIADEPEVSEEARLFISMVFMPLCRRIVDDRGLVEALFRYDSLPLHHRKAILSYWHTFSNEIQKAARRNGSSSLSAGASLKSLNYLRLYDQNEHTSHFDRVAAAYNSFAQVAIKADGEVNPRREGTLKTIRKTIYGDAEAVAAEGVGRQKKAVRKRERDREQEESLEDVMEKIDSLIGMGKIKEQIKTFINLVTVQLEREKRGLPVTAVSLHAVFHGPPGTGKTTIARLLGRVYRCLGLLEEGHLVETDRAGLVAGYVGQTAIKIDEVVNEAMDGVLFIDEAYTLAMNKGDRDFGREAIDTLLKRMEDNRERLAVIVAGYPDEMKEFINSNPGLKSRFNRFFYFDHYEPADLLQIFDLFMKNASFTLTGPARTAILRLLTDFHSRRDRSFGNGRFVRNLFERMVERQANRIATITPLTDVVLCSLAKADVPPPEDFEEQQ